jgi:branched-chain amino acid transport system substrate-binding protein
MSKKSNWKKSAITKVQAVVIAVIIIIAIIAGALYYYYTLPTATPTPATPTPKTPTPATPTPATPTPATPTPTPAKQEIVLGTHQSMTGIFSAQGSEIAWTIEKAVSDINKAGGVYVAEYGKKLPLRVVTLDDESDPSKAAECAEKLIKVYNVDFLISGHGATLVLPGMVTAEKYGVPCVGTFCFIEPFLEQKFQWSTLFFFETAQGGAVPFILLDHVNAPKTMGFVMEDSFDGKAFVGVLHGDAQKYGYAVVAEEYYTPGATDVSSIILKLKGAKVEHLIHFGSPADLVVFIRQCKELDYNWKFLMTYKSGWPIETWNALGKDAEYICSDGFFYPTMPYSGVKELWDAFYSHFGKFSVGGPGPHYACVQMLCQAIEKAGTLKKDVVLKTLVEQGPWETVMGSAKFDKNHVAIFQCFGFQWRSPGKLECLYPFDWASAELVYPAPSWRERS